MPGIMNEGLRIISGKGIKSNQVDRPMPENVRQWLRSYAVENQQLGDYDQLIEKEEKKDEPDSD